MNTPEELKAKAADMELKGLNFLDKKGRYCARTTRKPVKVEAMFIDGETVWVSYRDFCEMGSSVEFTLRPKLNNA